MKATMGTMYRSLQAQITKAGLRLQDLQNIAASGKKFNQPSDNPAAIQPVLDTQAQIKANDRYQTTMSTAQDSMNVLDGYMDNVENILVSVKQDAINSTNGSLSAADQNTLANQVDAMKSQLLQVANAQVDGKYIFAGFHNATQPFETNAAYGTNPSAPPVLYHGDGSATKLEIGPGEQVQTNLTGNAVFLGDANGDGQPDTGKVDIFSVLTQLSAAMRSNDTNAVQTQLANLDTASNQVETLRGMIGNNAKMISDASTQMQSTQVDLNQVLSQYQDADMVQTLSDLTQQQTAYQAALKVTAQVSQLSILNYL